MRILVSAYACEPGRGSEPGVGWHFAEEMSKRHSLTVVTRANNRSAIERSGENWTAGCIALEPEDMDALFAACGLGTPVTIE